MLIIGDLTGLAGYGRFPHGLLSLCYKESVVESHCLPVLYF